MLSRKKINIQCVVSPSAEKEKYTSFTVLDNPPPQAKTLIYVVKLGDQATQAANQFEWSLNQVTQPVTSPGHQTYQFTLVKKTLIQSLIHSIYIEKRTLVQSLIQSIYIDRRDTHPVTHPVSLH